MKITRKFSLLSTHFFPNLRGTALAFRIEFAFCLKLTFPLYCFRMGNTNRFRLDFRTALMNGHNIRKNCLIRKYFFYYKNGFKSKGCLMKVEICKMFEKSHLGGKTVNSNLKLPFWVISQWSIKSRSSNLVEISVEKFNHS